MDYQAVAHLNRVVKQSNKRECSYPLVMPDVSLSVRRTFVRIHYSSYMKVSIIIRQEVETLRKKGGRTIMISGLLFVSRWSYQVSHGFEEASYLK